MKHSFKHMQAKRLKSDSDIRQFDGIVRIRWIRCRSVAAVFKSANHMMANPCIQAQRRRLNWALMQNEDEKGIKQTYNFLLPTNQSKTKQSEAVFACIDTCVSAALEWMHERADTFLRCCAPISRWQLSRLNKEQDAGSGNAPLFMRTKAHCH